MQTGIAEFVRTVFLVIAALFPIVNPLGNVPIFLSLTADFTPDTRKVLARKIALNGFLLLAGSILIGTHVLAFFGISLPVVQVGGGMVVISTAWNLLNRHDDPEGKQETRATARPVDLSSRAFYPLTMPLTVWPGSISVAIAVGANRPQDLTFNWSYLPAAILGAVIVGLTIYLSYRFSQNVANALGDTAMKVIIRLSSFILLCIGVQIFWNGINTLLHSVLSQR